MKIESGIRNIIEKDEWGNVISETFLDEIRNIKLISFSYEYNSDAKLKKEIQEDGFGNSVEILYSYDEKGNCSEICVTEIDKGRRSFCFLNQYFYDSQGKMIKENEIYNEAEFTTDYIYDNDGNMIKSLQTDKWDCVDVCEYKYDSAGNMLTKTEYTPEGEICCVTSYSYNDAGQCETEGECTRKGFFRIYEYFYDSKGFKIKEVTKYFSKKSEEVYIVEHQLTNNNEGRVIHSKNTNDDYSEILYFYNEVGRLVVTDHFNQKDGQYYLLRHIDFGHGETIFSSFEYVYDSDGKLVSENIQKIDGT